MLPVGVDYSLGPPGQGFCQPAQSLAAQSPLLEHPETEWPQDPTAGAVNAPLFAAATPPTPWVVLIKLVCNLASTYHALLQLTFSPSVRRVYGHRPT